ncbi:RIN4, pathogenic type III effector avirulence factor Avr cleavage site [Dillenia turbinata]|uniref:RIN4, pathogenic type III effector avirulence factor Avr cleavage site n=1 Tax=Dillenia turbinata TaxID=194707 RepID=A0AAN8YXE4_9MAGN
MGQYSFDNNREKGPPLPKFGEWDVNDPASAEGFTVIFNKARNEKKGCGGGKPESPPMDVPTYKPEAQLGKPQAKHFGEVRFGQAYVLSSNPSDEHIQPGKVYLYVNNSETFLLDIPAPNAQKAPKMIWLTRTTNRGTTKKLTAKSINNYHGLILQATYVSFKSEEQHETVKPFHRRKQLGIGRDQTLNKGSQNCKRENKMIGGYVGFTLGVLRRDDDEVPPISPVERAMRGRSKSEEGLECC